MSNKEDIYLRIKADDADAFRAVQAFVAKTGKEFDKLPKSIGTIDTSVSRLSNKIDQMGRSRGPDTLNKGLAKLPEVVKRLTGGIDALSTKVDKLGASNGPGALYKDLAKLPTIIQQLSGNISTLSGKIDDLGRASGAKQVGKDLDEAKKQASGLARALDNVKAAGKAAGAVVAGIAAGKMIVQPHIDRAVDYDTQLSHLANVALADKSVAERIAGKKDLDATIISALRHGGGTREQGVETLSRILGSGVINDSDAKTMLPAVMRGATASGATPEQIADIGIRSMQNFGFKAEQLPRVLDMAIKSGNLGGFELKDMAKWLPAQMAEAATLGMKGERGLAQLLALNQAAITTAGSTDAAGNNVKNLLSKINSSDTQNDFKKQGINLTGSLQAAAGKGIDPVTAFSMLVDKVMSKDKNYVALEQRRRTTSNAGEQADILEKQLQLAEGTAIGKVLQDMQARSAFLGFKKQSESFKTQVDATINGAADGTTAGNFAVISSGSGFKRSQAENETLNAQNAAMQKLLPALDRYWEGLTKSAQEHPVLTAAMEGAKIAVSTMAASAGAAAAVLALLGRNASAAAGVATASRTVGAGGIPFGGFKGAMKANAAVAGAATLLDVYGIASNDQLTSQQKKIGYTSAAGGLLGGLGGAAAGAAIGTMIFPGIGTLGGLLLGGALSMGGNYLGSKAGELAGQSMFGEPSGEKVSQALADSIKSNPIQGQLDIKIAIDDQGRAYVANKTFQGQNLRVDTGPLMVY
ncbi:phage tail tape measure protein [Herbaspirillum huttiense]|uniref:Phage tail tape measure protein n=3 Tax=Pseudomonadota TaxID=1224 RepID=A0AAJ2H8R1_9BURK|nr:phage tail tape measure protein [Herbaspirillum huttiense]MDR9834883.1 phage tail tape measure protein [Herbaspirillum huttiense]